MRVENMKTRDYLRENNTTHSSSLDNSIILESNIILGVLNNQQAQTNYDNPRDLSSSFLKYNENKDNSRDTKSSSGIIQSSKLNSVLTTPPKKTAASRQKDKQIKLDEDLPEGIEETPINVKLTFEELLEQQLQKEQKP